MTLDINKINNIIAIYTNMKDYDILKERFITMIKVGLCEIANEYMNDTDRIQAYKIIKKLENKYN